MSDVRKGHPEGILRGGWVAQVEDYAIAGAWVRDAKGRRNLAVGDVAGGVYGFDGTSGRTLWSHAAVHEGGLLTMAVHPNESAFATAGQDGCVRIWSPAEGRVTATVELGDGWVENLVWSSDGKWLAASLGRHVHVFDAHGSAVWRSEEHGSTVSALAWAGSRELATACYGCVTFFEVPTGVVSQKMEWKGSLVSMVISPNGNIVACGSQDNSVHFWRRSSGEDSMMSGYRGKPSSLAFDSTGTVLATGGGTSVTVWSFQGDGPEGSRPGVLELHVRPISALAFARRGMELASGGRDGAVVVWSVERNGEGKPLGAALLSDVVSSLVWRPDGRALAALDGQGGVTAWQLGRKKRR